MQTSSWKQYAFEMVRLVIRNAAWRCKKLLNSTLYRNCSLDKCGKSVNLPVQEELVVLIAYELFAVKTGINIFLITICFIWEEVPFVGGLMAVKQY
jgi:hypothetical protein